MYRGTSVRVAGERRVRGHMLVMLDRTFGAVDGDAVHRGRTSGAGIDI